MRKNLYDFFSWMPFYFLLAPTLMVMVSWNSLPGDTIFPIKLFLEDVAIIFTSPSDTAKATLSVKYTERRFSEATTLLATKNSVKGFEYLERQVVNTRTAIQTSKDSKTRSELAQTYLVSLYAMRAQLEEQKQTYTDHNTPVINSERNKPISQPTIFALQQAGSGQKTTLSPQPTLKKEVSTPAVTAPQIPTGTNTPSPTMTISETPATTLIQTTPTPTPTQITVPEDAIVEIEDTQGVIEETIEVMESEAQAVPEVLQQPPAVPSTEPARTDSEERMGQGRGRTDEREDAEERIERGDERRSEE